MKLSNIKIENTAQSAIVYGPPKSGKTELMVRGLAAKFNVLYVDFEKGYITLLKLPDELKSKVDIIRVPDYKDAPNAIATGLHLASGKKVNICHEHGVKDCTTCKVEQRKDLEGDYFEEWCLNDLDPAEWVVVFDSFTQLTSSANAHVTKSKGTEDVVKVADKLTFEHWRAQGVLLEKFLDYVQNARYNVVVITHEMGIDQVDKTEKIQPSGGTKNFARNVPKYFDHIIYVSVKNRKHTAISNTTASSNIMSGSRTDIEVDMSQPESVCALFGKPVTPTTPAKATGAASGMSSKFASLKQKK